MARRGLGKGLRAYFPDYQEENSHSELEHEVSEQDGSHGEDEHSVDRKAKLEELDMVLPGSSRKAKADSDKKKAKKTGTAAGQKAAGKNTSKPSAKSGEKTEKGKTAGAGQKEEGAREQLLNIAQIEPNQEQPRKHFNEEQLKELAESVKNYGILQPLLVQKKGDFFEIIAGERRWRAAKLAGLKAVPVLIRDYTKQQTVEIALIENIQRENLNPIEEAMAFKRLLTEFSLKQDEVAERVSKSRTAVTNSMRLLKLNEKVQQMIIDDMISTGHARALLAIDDEEQQYILANKIFDEKLSVRETEKLIKELKNPKKEKKKKIVENDFIYRDSEERMKSLMGTKVSINQKANGKGKIEIEYYSEKDFERIYDLIMSIEKGDA